VIEEVQSHLVTAVAGAVIAAALLGAVSFERAQGEDLALQQALDGAAGAVARAGCSAAHPYTRIDLDSLLEGARDRLASLLLLADHLRASPAHGGALESLRFPPLAVLEPLELLGASGLELRFDPVDERCSVLLV
jgi:hypothetical protein